MKRFLQPNTAITLMIAAVMTFPTHSFANDAQIQVLRQQIKNMEQNGMGEMAGSMRDMLKKLEADAAKSRSQGAEKSSSNVKPSYYAANNLANLESCNATNEFQFDSICSASMLRYNDYLTSVSNNAPLETQEELWRRHVETAKVYINAIKK